MSDTTPLRFEPDGSLIDRITEEAAQFTRERLEAEGVEIGHVLVLVDTQAGTPEGENPSGIAAYGPFEGNESGIFVALVFHLRKIAESLGIPLHFGAMPPGGGDPSQN